MSWLTLFLLLAVAALIVTSGLVLLLAIHFHQKPQGVSRGHHWGHLHSVLPLVVSYFGTGLLHAGVPLRIFGNPVVLLTVPGRRTGQPRTALVDLYEQGGGRRFLVSTHGEDRAQWVQNLRAARTGILTRGRHRSEFTALELTPEIAGLVLRDLLGPRLASPLGGLALRQTLQLAPDASLSDFVRAAHAHPVFELYTSSAQPSPHRHRQAVRR
jgi:deazaflavin-dependent oxidoreductase (nitroreductase family)